MKSFVQWALPALLCAGSALAAVPISSVKRVSNLPIVPNKFIVEVDQTSNIPNKRLFARSLDAVYATLRERGIDFDVDKEFDSVVFVGASLTIENAGDAAALAKAPGIKAIRPVIKVPPPNPVFKKVVKERTDPAVPADTQATHILTGVDKLRAQGITGKGIKIGILDTGIDYTHPNLGGAFGPGNKVAGGADLVGDDYNGSNQPKPDSDPLDQCNGHGTHVAGIIAASGDNVFNITGVAPDATLSAYRIFGCVGFVSDDVIVEALLLGFKDGQDILTLSLGGANGWTESTASVIASRIAESGIIVTIAAGNDGSSGSWYSSSPGNGIQAISVASVENTVIPLQKATVGGVQHDPIIYFSTLPLPIQDGLPIYATSTDPKIANDACNALPDSTPDLSKFVVIVRRGTCPFVQKVSNIAKKGAKVALIYDNGTNFGGISVGNFTAALIQAADGEFLVKQFAAGAPVTITFPQTGGSIDFPSPSGGLVSTFSSYGPSNDFYFKPAVAAPGGNIISTLPVPLGSFAVESGTSMATPFVAGSAALLLSVRGKDPVVGRSARTLFETTAQFVPSSHTDGDPLQTVTQQGAGLINVFNAVYTTTIVYPGELILNDTAHFKSVHSFNVRNTGDSDKSFTLTHVPAGTAMTLRPGSIFPADGPVPLSAQYASVIISPSTFVLAPGQSRRVIAVFTPPAGLDPKTLPVYSGFINIAGPSEILHVSYIGSVGSLKDMQVVDNTDAFFGEKTPAIVDPNGNTQVNPTNYTFVGTDVPTLIWRQAFGTPNLRVDLVDVESSVPTNLRRREPRGPFFTFPFKNRQGTFTQVKIIGTLTEFNFITRNNGNPNDNGYNTFVLESATFANGTSIPNGSYRVLLRALKVTGDRTREEDHEAWLGPVIGVQSK